MSATVLVDEAGNRIELKQAGGNNLGEGQAPWVNYSHFDDGLAGHYAIVSGFEPDEDDPRWELEEFKPGQEEEVTLGGRKYTARHETEG